MRVYIIIFERRIEQTKNKGWRKTNGTKNVRSV